MPKRKRRIAPRQPNVGSILPVVQRMIAIDALLAGDGLVIDLAAEELGVVGRSVRRLLDILRQLAGPTVFEIDKANGRHRHWYAKGVKPLFTVNVKIKRRRGDRSTDASRTTMDFHTFTTDREACSRSRLAGTADEFYTMATAAALAGGSSQLYNQLHSERTWEDARKPYYVSVRVRHS